MLIDDRKHAKTKLDEVSKECKDFKGFSDSVLIVAERQKYKDLYSLLDKQEAI